MQSIDAGHPPRIKADNSQVPSPLASSPSTSPAVTSPRPSSSHCLIAQFAITINSNVCPHIRVPNMLMQNPMHDVIGIFNSESRY